MPRRGGRPLVSAAKKSAGGKPSGGWLVVLIARLYAFMAAFTASAVIGSPRTRAPHALNTALPMAGAITVTAGSPTPVAFSPFAITAMAISGTWLIRIGV